MAEESSPTAQGDSRLVVLLVSDDPDVRRELEYGWPAGTRVLVAMDSREAWALMKEIVPAIVVADIQSGSAGGYGLARDMDSSERLAGVPLMMLLERPQDGWLAEQAGAVAWRVKPVETTELVASSLELSRRSG